MNLSDESKNKFVAGYKTAMVGAFNTLSTECVDATKEAKPGGVEALVKVYESVCKIAASFDFGFDEQDISRELDTFYKDPQHVPVSINVALHSVRDILLGKRPHAGIGIASP